MMALLWLSVLFASSLVVVHCQPDPPMLYFCHVADMCASDPGATCDTATGACTCTVPGSPDVAMYGYNCKVPTGTNPPAPGMVGVQCVVDRTEFFGQDGSGGFICYCKYYAINFNEDDCSESRVQLDCDGDPATGAGTLTLHPHDGFSGRMFFLDASDDAFDPTTALETDIEALPKQTDCLMAEIQPGVYTKSGLSYEGAWTDASCTAATKSTVDGTTTTYWYFLYVQQSPSIFGEFDEIIRLQCISEPGGMMPVVVDATSVETDPDVYADQAPVKSTFGLDVSVSVRDSENSNAAISGAVGVGHDINIYMEAGDGVDFSANGATAYSSDPDGDTTGQQTADLITAWCLLRKALGMVNYIKKVDSTTTPTPAYIEIGINAFVFDSVPSDQQGEVWFKLSLCKGDCSGQHDPATCSSNTDYVPHSSTYANTATPFARRKRRDVDGSETIEDGDVTSVNVHVTVEYPGKKHASQKGLDECIADKEPCFTTLHFLLPLVTMGAILLLSLAMSVYLFRMTYRPQRNSGMTAAANQGFQHREKL